MYRKKKESSRRPQSPHPPPSFAFRATAIRIPMYDIGDGPALPILVDDFRHVNGVSSYFLTHLHADHTRGICKNWSNGVIYCSDVTLRLFNHKFKDLTVPSRSLRSLELGVPHALQLSSSMAATVTLVDANHCPGAVMIVIEVHGRCIVHTGDCRWHSRMAQLPCLFGKNVHTAFLDCTYGKPQFTFPSREEAAAQVVALARKHLHHIVYIAVDTLGKEELLVAVAQALGEKIFITLDRFLRMSLCEFNMSLFTTEADRARIRTMDRRQLTQQFIQSRQQAQACVGIVPTGWSLENAKQNCVSDVQSHFYTVPYSLHSSYDELADFVRRVRPKQIVPTSDNEAGGLESCSALCLHALGCDAQVQVTALDSITRNHETASSILIKRSASGLFEMNRGHSRRRVVSVGATADSPSPNRSPQPDREFPALAEADVSYREEDELHDGDCVGEEERLPSSERSSVSGSHIIDIDDVNQDSSSDVQVLEHHSSTPSLTPDSTRHSCASSHESERSTSCSDWPFGGPAAYF